MFTAACIVVGIVLAWVVVDRLVLWQDQRLHRGHAAWAGPDKVFHSTGWEDTVPPQEANERMPVPPVTAMRRRSIA